MEVLAEPGRGAVTLRHGSPQATLHLLGSGSLPQARGHRRQARGSAYGGGKQEGPWLVPTSSIPSPTSPGVLGGCSPRHCSPAPSAQLLAVHVPPQ